MNIYRSSATGPLWTRPGVRLWELFIQLGKAEYGMCSAAYPSLAEIHARIDEIYRAEFLRWEGQMRMIADGEVDFYRNWRHHGPYEQFLDEARRDWAQLQICQHPSRGQPAARGEQDESTPLVARLGPGLHWPQPEPHGQQHLPQPMSLVWRFRGDLGLGRFVWV